MWFGEGLRVNKFLMQTFQRFLCFFLYLVLFGFFFQSWKWRVNIPGANSGDEPHYLLTLNSIVEDNDYRLENNYAKKQFGKKFQTLDLDHHTFLFDPNTKKFFFWEEFHVWDPDSKTWKEKPGSPPTNLETENWLPTHGIGYPSVLALFLWPIPIESREDSIAIFQICLLCFAFALITSSKNFFFQFLFLMGIPGFLYAFQIYSEGILVSLAIFGVYFWRKDNLGVAIFFFGLMVWVKDIYLVVYGISFAYYGFLTLFSKDPIPLQKRDLFFLLLSFLPVGGLFFLKWIWFGNPFQSYIPFVINTDFLGSLYRWFFDSKKGFLVLSPVLVCFGAWIFSKLRFWKENFKTSAKAYSHFLILLVSVFLIWIVSFCHESWSGGNSFGHRPFVTGMFFLVPYFLAEFTLPQTKIWKLVLGVFLLASVLNQFFAFTNLNYSFGTNAYLNLWNGKESTVWNRFR